MGSMLLAVDPSKSSKKMRTTPNPFRLLRHPAISPPSPRIKCPIGGEPRSVPAQGPEYPDKGRPRAGTGGQRQNFACTATWRCT
ncbi:unnamed protein product [Gadus morhua 'NCC']